MSTQNCSNCYNGCTEITSDKCVKYTGVDVPILGIKNGDSLSFVEQALITFLGAALDGTGILPVVPASDICPVVQANLDDCNPLSLNNYLVGIIKTICILNEQLENIQGGAPNGAYTLECVTGVQNPNSTSDVLQQTIVKLCEVEQSLNTFITDVTNNYVQIVDINTYIANYFNTNPEQQLLSNRMVPGSAQAYFGALTPFDASGAGIGVWDRIFLCNGNNGTPDLRGRVVAGYDSMGGSSADRLTNFSGGVNGDVLGGFGGLESCLLTGAMSGVAAHTHLYNKVVINTSNGVIGDQGFASNQPISADTEENDGGNVDAVQAHNNVQPTIILTFIIKT